MKPHRDWFGRLLSLLVFLTGILLMLIAFWLAYRMFQTPPQRLFQGSGGNNPNLGTIATGIWAALRSILLLVLMAIVGGMIANRGITLYLAVRRAESELMPHRPTPDTKPNPPDHS
jgi:predicted permease